MWTNIGSKRPMKNQISLFSAPDHRPLLPEWPTVVKRRGWHKIWRSTLFSTPKDSGRPIIPRVLNTIIIFRYPALCYKRIIWFSALIKMILRWNHHERQRHSTYFFRGPEHIRVGQSCSDLWSGYHLAQTSRSSGHKIRWPVDRCMHRHGWNSFISQPEGKKQNGCLCHWFLHADA